MIKQLLAASLAFSLFFSSAFAVTPRVKIDGAKLGIVPLYQSTVPSAQSVVNLQKSVVISKTILFQRIKLSTAAQRYLAEHISDSQNPAMVLGLAAAANAVENGMDNVPVFDQGPYGACATFAATAALDAAYHHGDYISQLCNLALGKYLSSLDATYPSGWDGSTNEAVLAQVKKYGAINTSYQKQVGCGGLKEYPAQLDENTTAVGSGGPMTLSDFAQHSQKIMSDISYRSLLNIEDGFSSKNDTEALLSSIKLALLKGHRVVVGVLIDDYVDFIGVQASYKAPRDSWVLTPEIVRDAKASILSSGHAMVITGYNENAVITDIFKVPHKGVLTLRNSWGTIPGDHGTFYMSYDYFKALVLEAKEILPLTTT